MTVDTTTSHPDWVSAASSAEASLLPAANPTNAIPFADAVERIRQQLDIVTIVSRHVPLKRSGKHYVGLCPFHPDKRPSMTVSREKNIYKCFSCGAGGDAFGFLMAIEHQTFGQVVSELADQMGLTIARSANPEAIALQQAAASQAKEDRQRLLSLHERTARWYQAQLSTTSAGQEVQSYLARRGMSTTVIENFGLGYAPAGWDALVKAVTQSGQIPLNDLLLGGLASQKEGRDRAYDRFRNRLMIPITDEQGRPIAFGGRALALNNQPEDDPKYLNSPETPIYHKSQTLFGLSQAKAALRQTRTALVMEGYFDVMAAHQAGVTHTVGVCGTALTEEHLRLLYRLGVEQVWLCFDSDTAGVRATLHALDLADSLALNENILIPPKVGVLSLPDFIGDGRPNTAKDPADWLALVGPERFVDWANHSGVEGLPFRIEVALRQIALQQGYTATDAGVSLSLNTASGRADSAEVIAPLLARIKQPVRFREWVETYARRLHIHPKDLETACQAYRSPNIASSKTRRPSQAISNFQGSFKHHELGMGPSQRSALNKLPVPDASQQLRRVEESLLTWGLFSRNTYNQLMQLLQSTPLHDPDIQAFCQSLSNAMQQAPATTQPLEAMQDWLHQQRIETTVQPTSSSDSSSLGPLESVLASISFSLNNQQLQATQLGWDTATSERAAQQQLARLASTHRTLSRQKALSPLVDTVRALTDDHELELLEAQYAFRSTLTTPTINGSIASPPTTAL
ncbi:MAG: DNA primase [Vampirovibrionales bacterium]